LFDHFITSASLLFFLSIFIVWAFLLRMRMERRPILPVGPRRQVPWNGWDILLFVILYFAVSIVSVLLFDAGNSSWSKPSSVNNYHPLVLLVLEGDSSKVAISILIAVVTAPIFEEFFFRLILQGWLEKLDRRLRKERIITGIFRWGTLPVVGVSFIFAALHFRTGETLTDPESLYQLMLINIIASGITFAFSLIWLVVIRRASLTDFGIVPKKICSDFGLGIVAFLAMVVPVFGTQKLLELFSPSWLAVDPVPLFLFSILTGTLYLRTHRIVPSIALHMSLNGFSMLMLWQLADQIRANLQ
jgi:membrane protease YdiL (CAAX protease family)